MDKEQVFLCLAAIGLTPIALGYGLVPQVTMPVLYDISPDSVGEVHILRAVMGLYLGMVVFWVLGALRVYLRYAALCSVAVFMLGLAAGRALSLLVDGMPAVMLVVYLLLEVGFGAVAITLASRLRTHS